ncbi:putative phosphatase [Actinoplanes missouriensis 431]|uniref:Putative phosphatase n=1 Tax=Actinoplanes missouriensis (strain ATCC 14538 / DSM 43046 / CBS 188.64 / JCM 3121 / NBRC 102363 / NCIMB 12654 / NRRL B-3342 / UNCC 431) TaxID=512565 RepID=I0HFH4_ACTM4|nr:phosphatase PAP2 family protein [Actinoplanes missouriensis]BAL91761.1 putative phosphatase [Actinoplanes missouriensis 431]
MDDTRVVERTGWAPVRHFAERSVLGLIAVLAVGLGFGVLLLLVRFHWGPLQDLDRSVADGLNRWASGSETVVAVLQQISSAGGRGFMIPLVALLVLMLIIRRRPRPALYLVVTGLGAMILDPSLKALIGRVRPVVEVPVATAPGNSFPSGHALGSMVVYGMIVLVFLPAVRRRWRPFFIGAAAVIVAAIGFTRIALGVHFLSDVLAGWLLGVAWISATAYAFRMWRREAGHTDPHLTDGLEPEAGPDLRLAPAEGPVLPHPWAKAAEILVGWVFVFGLLYLVGYTVTRWTPGFDTGFVEWLQTFRTERLDKWSWAWSKAGDTHAILFISLIFCPLALALWRQWRPVLFLVLTMVGELTLFLCAAAAVGRPRPPVEQLDGQMPTSSFPSGHIAATMCLWAAIAIITMARIRQPWRWIFPALAVIMPLGVALSRMYRGMHHPTDMLGAAILTTAWLTVLWFTIRPNAHPASATEAASEAVAATDSDRLEPAR